MLITQTSYNNLNNLKIKANSLSGSLYTQQTWTAVTTSLALPETIQTKVNSKIKSLNLSIKGLIKIDTTPDAFDIIDMTNQSLNTEVITNEVTLTGVNIDVSVTTTLGTIVKNGVKTLQASVIASPGDKLSVAYTTGIIYSKTENLTLTIGTLSDNFTISTLSGGGGSVDVPSFTVHEIQLTDPVNDLGGAQEICFKTELYKYLKGGVLPEGKEFRITNVTFDGIGIDSQNFRIEDGNIVGIGDFIGNGNAIIEIGIFDKLSGTQSLAKTASTEEIIDTINAKVYIIDNDA